MESYWGGWGYLIYDGFIWFYAHHPSVHLFESLGLILNLALSFPHGWIADALVRSHHPFRKSPFHAWMNGNPWAVYCRGCVPSGIWQTIFLGGTTPNFHQAGFSLIRGWRYSIILDAWCLFLGSDRLSSYRNSCWTSCFESGPQFQVTFHVTIDFTAVRPHSPCFHTWMPVAEAALCLLGAVVCRRNKKFKKSFMYGFWIICWHQDFWSLFMKIYDMICLSWFNMMAWVAGKLKLDHTWSYRIKAVPLASHGQALIGALWREARRSWC